MAGWAKALEGINAAMGDIATRPMRETARHMRRGLKTNPAVRKATGFMGAHPYAFGAAGLYGAAMMAAPGSNRARGRSSAMYGVPKRSSGGYA